jgi:hypothetical protein
MNCYLIIIILVLILIILFTNNCRENFNENIKLAEKYLSESNIKTLTNKNGVFPITFIDENKNILGKYPNMKINDTETTYIEIPRGEKGEKGIKGEDGKETQCKGNVILDKIESDNNLDIKAENIHLNTDRIDINNKLCFDGDLRNCLDSSIIEKIKLVNNNEKKIRNLETEKTNLENNFDKCKLMNENIKNNIKKNYLSKDTEIPYTYIEAQKCNDEKKELENIYNVRIKNNDDILNKYNDVLKESTKLKATIRNKEFSLLENNNSISKYQNENTELFNKNLHLNSKIDQIKNSLEKKETLLNEYINNDINLDNYIEKEKHNEIINNNYIEKNILDNYIEKKHLENNYKDKYGNYLTNDFVTNNYELKDLIESKKNYECNIKLHYLNNGILSDDISSEKLSKDYDDLVIEYETKNNILNDELKKCKEDQNKSIKTQDIEKDYILKTEVENNYILNTEYNKILMDNYISKKEIENGNYIKIDNNFRDKYVNKQINDSLVLQYRKCNDNKDYDRREYNKIIEENKILNDEFNKFNCKISDKINYDKIDLENCKIDKNYMFKKEKELKENILTLGNYIDKLNSTLILNKEEIKNIENEKNKLENVYNIKIKKLENELRVNTIKIDDREKIIKEIENNKNLLEINNEKYKKEIKNNYEIINLKENQIKNLNNDIKEKRNTLNSTILILQNYNNLQEKNEKYLDLIKNLQNDLSNNYNNDIKI